MQLGSKHESLEIQYSETRQASRKRKGSVGGKSGPNLRPEKAIAIWGIYRIQCRQDAEREPCVESPLQSLEI